MHTTIGKPFVLSTVCLLALFSHAHAATTTAASSPQYTSASTCPSRTINYITETLPQQCLRTSWSSNATNNGSRDVFTAAFAEGDPSTAAQSLTALKPGPSADQTASSDSIASLETSFTPKYTDTSFTSSSDTSGATSAPQESASSASDSLQDQEIDPLSDNSNFLSFEEWKSQMLKKAGQSAENIGGVRKGDTNPETRRRPAGVNHQALDSLGDDTEIELDFGGFGNPDSISNTLPPSKLSAQGSDKEDKQATTSGEAPRSREAGITSKERFNYASFDCAATVLKANTECKGSNAILLENKDSYMLNACSAKNKFFVVELCNDILIDTIALGNYEFFSSTFRTFRVGISDRYPVKADKWKEIGTFEAQNTRGVQAFLVENGLIWARYLRIEFLTHYGNEYYCPVSLLRVHGKTMIDDYRNDVKTSRGEDDVDEDIALLDTEEEELVAAPVAEMPTTTSKETTEETTPTFTVSSKPAVESEESYSPNHFKDKCPRTNYISPLVEQAELSISACNSSRKFCNLELATTITWNPRSMSMTEPAIISSTSSSNKAPDQVSSVSNQDHVAPSSSSSVSLPGSSSINSTQSASSQLSNQATSIMRETTPSPASKATPGSSKPATTPPDSPSDGASHIPSKPFSHPPAPSPSTQESFFKSVHKRLQLLEANSTLSLQYIEEQSRILREAFIKVEKRQLSKTTTFLESLNVTVLSELREFRLQYDQIWQSTILELSSQREQSQREAVALTSRLALLADEVLWQKRIVYLQFGLILLCLALVIFSRGHSAGTPSYLELPILQNMIQRSSTLSRQLGLESPPGTPSRPESGYGLSSRHTNRFRPASSNGSPTNDDEAKSPTIDYQPPTPPSEAEERASMLARSSESPELEPSMRRVMSSPALGQGSAEGTDEGGSPGLLHPMRKETLEVDFLGLDEVVGGSSSPETHALRSSEDSGRRSEDLELDDHVHLSTYGET